jgi:hypothetical protein
MTYLGKRVEVKIPARGDNGKLNGKFTTVVGICKSEPQKNEILDIPLQTVVGRMPVTLNSLNDIKIL